MKLTGKPSRKVKGIYLLLALLPLTFTFACAGGMDPAPPPKPDVHKKAPSPPFLDKKTIKAPALPPLAQVKPEVAAEEEMPYDTKVFSLSARSAPLQDVVMGLAKEAGMNLVIEKGVNPLEPVSIEINNLTLRKALDLLFSAYDYYYEIEGNVLWVKAMETRFFKFEQPIFYNSGTSDVGGDVLGGSGSSGLTGEFSVESEQDDDALNIWDQIEDALSPGDEVSSDSEGSSGGGETAGLLSPNGRATIDKVTGTIVVTDSRERLALVEKYLSTLEESLTRQVMIEARIMEVQLDDSHQFGIDWDYVSGDVTFAQTLATGVGALNVGITPTNDEPNVLVDALATQGNVNVLSSPRLNVLNNQSALLAVGRTIPYLEWQVEPATDTTPSRAVPTVSTAQAGISLGVTPMIRSDGVVTLHIVPIITDFVGSQSFTFEGNTFDVPIIDVRSSDSIIQAPDGFTVIMAGLMQERNADNVSGIPYLKDIPGIGALFSTQSREITKVELVITLTPTIIQR